MDGVSAFMLEQQSTGVYKHTLKIATQESVITQRRFDLNLLQIIAENLYE
jgi:hypothetical protein